MGGIFIIAAPYEAVINYPAMVIALVGRSYDPSREQPPQRLIVLHPQSCACIYHMDICYERKSEIMISFVNHGLWLSIIISLYSCLRLLLARE